MTNSKLRRVSDPHHHQVKACLFFYWLLTARTPTFTVFRLFVQDLAFLADHRRAKTRLVIEEAIWEPSSVRLMAKQTETSHLPVACSLQLGEGLALLLGGKAARLLLYLPSRKP
jgi:hypothetical protein